MAHFLGVTMGIAFVDDFAVGDHEERVRLGRAFRIERHAVEPPELDRVETVLRRLAPHPVDIGINRFGGMGGGNQKKSEKKSGHRFGANSAPSKSIGSGITVCVVFSADISRMV